jgi:hypothetical protein
VDEKGKPKLFHDLRRTAVRNLERSGVSRSQATKITGHKTESVYKRYAIVNEQDQRVEVMKIAALWPEAKPADREILQEGVQKASTAEMAPTGENGKPS